jgi:hypothetical protein
VTTTRTWIGGGNNQASNPNNWIDSNNQPGAPQPGDALTIASGTMNVAGDALAGDTLTAGSQGPIQINASHHANIDLSETTPEANVDLSVQGTMSLQLHQFLFNALHTQGGNIRFISGSSITDGVRTTFDSNLLGDTTVVITGGGGEPASVEINGQVHSGLIFEVGGGGATLTLDKPAQFHGEVTVNVIGGRVELVGLTKADSWSYSNDMLTIRDSRNHVVDRLDIVSEGNPAIANGLSLSKTTDGTVNITWGQDFRGTLT